MQRAPHQPPLCRSASPRHALLFELIRQRGLAQSVSQRLASAPERHPADLLYLATLAARSLSARDQPPARW
ncbi:MAG: hypothetical protein COW54_10210 [Rhodobacteraceae bacterium CG17_big_fil_post_rev_8_21_14_2_50_63_15]|nr:MAG: hypothetical protein COW54_10210 [Rhodobacteraceae bacterium CG17_big_fil_post_rev_8_21_14_2_50_63_15]